MNYGDQINYIKIKNELVAFGEREYPALSRQTECCFGRESQRVLSHIILIQI